MLDVQLQQPAGPVGHYLQLHPGVRLVYPALRPRPPPPPAVDVSQSCPCRLHLVVSVPAQVLRHGRIRVRNMPSVVCHMQWARPQHLFILYQRSRLFGGIELLWVPLLGAFRHFCAFAPIPILLCVAPTLGVEWLVESCWCALMR